MQKTKYWHRLDNAAKVFPAISRSGNSNVFRLSFYLTENINPDILSEAVNIALRRFEVFNIQLRNGIFWNYFAENKSIYLVEEESHIIGEHFKFNKNKGFLFKVYYFNNKITLEAFHSLTDGTGALEFLKAITFEYLTLMGYDLEHENLILTRKPFSNNENKDAFLSNYNKNIKKKLKEEKAFHLSGEKFKDNWSLAVKLKLPLKPFLKMVKEKYNVTITQYLTALIAYSIYCEGLGESKSKQPIKMFVPVNLRPYFDSTTLRNFSLYVKSTYHLNREWTFEEMLEVTKTDFEKQLDKDELQMHIGALVGLEKNVFVKYVPLFIKTFMFKIGYKILGASINTSSISNLGIVNLPKDLEKHVVDVDFFNTGPSLNSTVVTYRDHLNFTLNTIYKDISIIKAVIYQIRKDGVNITVNTNYREGYDETL